MVDTSIVSGIINQLITGGHHLVELCCICDGSVTHGKSRSIRLNITSCHNTPHAHVEFMCLHAALPKQLDQRERHQVKFHFAWPMDDFCC